MNVQRIGHRDPHEPSRNPLAVLAAWARLIGIRCADGSTFFSRAAVVARFAALSHMGAALALLSASPVTALSLQSAGDPRAVESPTGASELASAVDSIVDAALGSTPFPRVVIGVVHGEEAILSSAYGNAESGSGEAADVGYAFPIGSTTKAMTTTLLAVLTNRGLLDFSDAISRHLPAALVDRLASGVGAVTLEQVASHYSGLPSELSDSSNVASPDFRTQTEGDLARALEGVTLEAPPGTRWQYSNLGYTVLGQVIENVTGLDYASALRRFVLDPLGMTHTTVGPRSTPDAPLAPGFSRPEGGGRVTSTPALDLGVMAPAGGVTSTVQDLARFLALHMEGANGPRGAALSVDAAALADTHRARWKSDSGPVGYGLGWGSTTVAGAGPVVFHDGGMPGYAAYVGFAPEHRVGVVLLTNLGTSTAVAVRELAEDLIQTGVALLASTEDGREDTASGAGQDIDLDDAFGYFNRIELQEARDAFAHVARYAADAEDRTEAYRMAAMLAWRIHRQWSDADQLLTEALALGADSSRTLAAISRLERERHHFPDAVEAARESIRTASNVAEEVVAAMALGDAALAAAEPMVLADSPQTIDRTVAAWVDEAQALLAPMVDEHFGLLNLATLALRLSLLTGDGSTALAAWRSYYATLLGSEQGRMVDAALELLDAPLSEWNGGPLTASARSVIGRGLAQSGMFAEARMVAGGFAGAASPEAPPAAEAKQVIAYADFLRRLEGDLNEYYRRTAAGDFGPEGSLDTVRVLLDRHARDLWSGLDSSETAEDYSLEALLEHVRTRFRAYVALARSSGRYSLWYAHVMVDDSLEVSQYGQQATVQFVAVDGVLSNGFNSWARDYRSQTGGTANEERVLQFRPSYANGPIDAWFELTDPDARAQLIERAETQAKRDWERAAEDPAGYLPGLDARLRLEGLEGLRDAVAGRGLSGSALERAFLVAYRDAIFGSSIAAHEGRHAIDRRMGLEDDPLVDKEFRAKLSEVAFAAHPRLALNGILSSNIGGSSAHGQANARIMRALIAWMEDHSGEIAGLEAERPLLPQLYRLTNDQLRAAFASMDPLAPTRDD